MSGLKVTIPLGLADPEVRWFFIGDDDTFVALNGLAAVVSQYDHSLPYLIGQVNYHIDGHRDTQVHGVYGGAGYVISRQLAVNILPHLSECDFYHGITVSDLFLSRCMIELANATLVDRLEFGSQPPWYYHEQQSGQYEMIRTGYQKAATFHYVTPRSPSRAPPWTEWYYLYRLWQAFSD